MLKTTFANAEFANPFMNASGVHCMTTEDLEELKASQAGVVFGVWLNLLKNVQVFWL